MHPNLRGPIRSRRGSVRRGELDLLVAVPVGGGIHRVPRLVAGRVDVPDDGDVRVELAGGGGTAGYVGGGGGGGGEVTLEASGGGVVVGRDGAGEGDVGEDEVDGD